MRTSQQSPPNTKVLADLTSDLNQTRLEYAAYQTTLYAAHPALRLQNGAIEPVTLLLVGVIAYATLSGPGSVSSTTTRSR